MQRLVFTALVTSALGMVSAVAEPLPLLSVPSIAQIPPPAEPAPVRMAVAQRGGLGGGFIEFLFGGSGADYAAPPRSSSPMPYPAEPSYMRVPDASRPGEGRERPPADPKFDRQLVAYDGEERPGTVIIDTSQRFLFLVEGNGKAMRYGIGVGRPGFTWAGVKQISAKREWPDWRPPDEMLKRRPDLPHYMAGGPQNPLGARAMYLGSSLYRIHGSNEPWTIGQAVSSGCIRMRNEDVIDLYDRIKVGTRVIVI